MIGKLFRNKTGKRIQFPLRISDEFNWGPGERIQIIHQIQAQHRTAEPESGYIVRNIDYCGNISALESAWISIDLLKSSFEEINE